MKLVGYIIAGIVIVPFILAVLCAVVAWPLYFFDPNGWYTAYIIMLIGAVSGVSAYIEEQQ